MGYLNVISVAEVDRWLSLDLDPDDVYASKEIERLIKTAIDWVEKYTSYRLYQREEIIANSKWSQVIASFPINSITVTNQDSETAEFKKWVQPTKLKIECPCNSIITLSVGYTDPADIPGPLIDACYKLITYLNENRDMYTAQLPSDVQVLINQYRRALI